MTSPARIINASFDHSDKNKDATLVFFATLDDGSLIRIEDTGPKSYLCKRYNILSNDAGKDDFREIIGKEMEVEFVNGLYRFVQRK